MTTPLCILILIFLLQLFSVKSQLPPSVPALYVLGDSLSDSGNNNNRYTTAKANYPPYGVDFMGGIPTGRFTNGKTFVDFAAEVLRLPFVPAYLTLTDDQRAKTGTGVNYASGSAGILDETGRRLGQCVPLKEQLDNLERSIRRDLSKMFRGRKALGDHLARSIFFVSIGSNDYINNFLQPDYYYVRRPRPTPQAFAQSLIDALERNMERLYRLGARKVVMFDIGPIGCIPNNTNTQPVKGQCSQEINNFVLEFNNRFTPLVQHLNSTLRGSHFIPGLTYPITENMYRDAARLGFTFTNHPCCHTHGDGIGPCTANNPPCPDRNKHLYYDSYHPTEAANLFVANACFRDVPSKCFPPNTGLQRLAEL